MPIIIKSADGYLFEVDELGDKGETRIGRAGQVVQEVNRTFQEVLETQVRPAAEKIVAVLREVSPQEIQVEFGIKIAGEVGAIFTKAGVDAHFTVKLKWDRKEISRNDT